MRLYNVKKRGQLTLSESSIWCPSMSPSLSPPESVLSLRSSPNPGCAFRRCRWNIRENMDIIVFMDIYLFIETIVFMDIYVFMDIIVFMDIYVFMDIIVFMNIILFFSAILPPKKKICSGFRSGKHGYYCVLGGQGKSV